MTGQKTTSDAPGSAAGATLKPSAGTATERSDAVRHMRSTELFGASREVVIRHDHHVYRLKLTSRGGLILTK